MMFTKRDFRSVSTGKVSLKDMSEFYGVSEQAFKNAMSRKGYTIKTKKRRLNNEKG